MQPATEPTFEDSILTTLRLYLPFDNVCREDATVMRTLFGAGATTSDNEFRDWIERQNEHCCRTDRNALSPLLDAADSGRDLR